MLPYIKGRRIAQKTRIGKISEAIDKTALRRSNEDTFLLESSEINLCPELVNKLNTARADYFEQTEHCMSGLLVNKLNTARADYL